MRYKFPSKRLFLSLGLVFVFIAGSSQESVVKKYLEMAGDNAIAYSGEIAPGYSPVLFSNTPYYYSPAYAPGVIYFRNTYYPDQQLRIDLYKDQLILLSPQMQGVIVDPRTVKSVQVHDKEFIWHSPPAQSGMPTGYYIRLADGSEVELLCRYSFILQNPGDKVQRHFYASQKYYILYNGAHYPVNSRNSFNKVFPSMKKRMKAFEKADRREYTGIADRALKKEQRFIRLAIFCDQSLSKEAKQ